MAQIEFQAVVTKKTKRKSHPFLRIDMTPMVDLGFLLITFFILTTTLSEKKAMKLVMPADGPPTVSAESKVLTVLLGQNNKVLAYEGKFETAMRERKVLATSYNEINGIGKLLRDKQKQLQQRDGKEGKNGLLFLIKPTSKCSFKNLVDALDETSINGVKKYMIVDPSREEVRQFENNDQ